MKVLNYTDFHYRDTGEFRPWNKVGPSGLTYDAERIIKTAEFVRDTILSERPDLVVNEGDSLNSMNMVSTTTLHLAGICFNMIDDACHLVGAEHIVIVGNHDWFSSDAKITSARIFQRRGTQLIDEYVIKEYGDKKYGFIPYLDKRIKFETEYYSAINDCDILFTHYAFRGAKFNSYYKDEEGIDAGKSNTIIISGHAHIPQQLGNVHYVGSPLQWKVRESEIRGFPRGVLLIKHGDFINITRIKNTYVKDIALISNIEELRKYPADKYAIKYVGPEIDETLFDGYEYDKVFLKEHRENVRVTYINKTIIDPKDMLLGFIRESHPELEEIYNELHNRKQ